MKKGVPLLLAGLWLIIFGLLAVYSVSIYESFELTRKYTNIFSEITNYYYFSKQIKVLCVALLAVLILWKIPFQRIKNHTFASISVIIGWLVQLLVFIPKLAVGGDEGLNGARGRIKLLGYSFQPVELFKLTFVFFLSSRLIRKKADIWNPWFIVMFIVINALLYAILLFVPDLWSILIMGGSALLMVRFAGLSIKKTASILLLGLGAGLCAWFGLSLINPNYNYIQNRFANFFSSNKKENQQTVQRQNDQAMLAIWWGGFFGQGLGKGLQKFWNIPEAQSDFIFAAFSEEIGFIWNCILLGLFIFIFSYSLRYLQSLKDPHSKMLGVGIVSIMMIQTFVHIGVNLDLVPNTWVTLPFVSSGGTSLIFSCIELMLLYKIIRSEETEQPLPLK